MKRAGLLAGLIFLLALGAGTPVVGQGPVKWSVPLHQYPRPWVSTTVPPPPVAGPAYPYPQGYNPQGYGAYNPGYQQGYAPGYPQWYQQGAYTGYPPQPQQ